MVAREKERDTNKERKKAEEEDEEEEGERERYVVRYRLPDRSRKGRKTERASE